MGIDVETVTPLPQPTLTAVRSAARSSLEFLGNWPSSITVLIADDRRLRQLNVDFRGIDGPTDVLSFAVDSDFPQEDGEEPYLGDIAISAPYASRQAEAAGHALEEELQLLTVHGVLHLLGHDHGEDDEKAEMWRVQNAILDQLGVGHINPTEI